MVENQKSPVGEIVVYQTEDGSTRVECRFEEDSLWLSQALIGELYQVSVPTVNEHLKNIYDEGDLLRFPVTLVLVTHDRMFLRKIATRTVELDRGHLVDWACDYDIFEKRRQAALDNEAVHWEKFDKKLAREEAWIRQGIKARRTRNEGRVRELKRLREIRRNRREHTGPRDNFWPR